jgi:hypothetical protein
VEFSGLESEKQLTKPRDWDSVCNHCDKSVIMKVSLMLRTRIQLTEEQSSKLKRIALQQGVSWLNLFGRE